MTLFLTAFVHADHVRWQSAYDKAHQEAVKAKKKLMVLLIEDECAECLKMLSTTFIDQPYIAYINQQFVAVIVRKGQKESYPIEMLYTMEYPAVFFLDQNELFVRETVVGYMRPDAFKKHLDLK